MICPYCGAPAPELRVIETTHTADQVRRRRKCGLCDQRFSTVELVVKDRQRTTNKTVIIDRLTP